MQIETFKMQSQPDSTGIDLQIPGLDLTLFHSVIAWFTSADQTTEDLKVAENGKHPHARVQTHHYGHLLLQYRQIGSPKLAILGGPVLSPHSHSSMRN